MKVTFIIIVYKPESETLSDLISALDDKEIILVNNGGLRIQEFNKNITRINASHNLGYAGGANLGIKEALQNGSDWIVILNQDLKFTPDGVNNLLEQLKKSSSGVAGPFVGSLDRKRWTTNFPNTGKRIDYISGSCVAIHRDVITKIGNFYEPYFMYYEDVDFSIRARQVGFPLVKLNADGVSHRESQSLKKGSVLHEYYLARNHLLFIERLAPWNVRLRELIRLPKTLWQHVRRSRLGGRVGIKDYFLRRFGESRL